MHHLYLSYQPSAAALEAERGALEAWCGENGVGEREILHENLTGRISLYRISRLLKGVRAGDTVVTVSLSRLGRSIGMLTLVLETIFAKGAQVVCIDSGVLDRSVLESLRCVRDIDRDIRAERSAESLFRATAEGRKSGRPVGSKRSPEKSVLYGKTERLEALRAQGLTPREIAGQLGVSRGTVVNYLKSKGL